MVMTDYWMQDFQQRHADGQTSSQLATLEDEWWCVPDVQQPRLC